MRLLCLDQQTFPGSRLGLLPLFLLPHAATAATYRCFIFLFLFSATTDDDDDGHHPPPITHHALPRPPNKEVVLLSRHSHALESRVYEYQRAEEATGKPSKHSQSRPYFFVVQGLNSTPP